MQPVTEPYLAPTQHTLQGACDAFQVFVKRKGAITDFLFHPAQLSVERTRWPAPVPTLQTRIASSKWVLCGHELLANHPLSRQQGNNQALETDVQASTLQASVVNGHTGRPKVCRPSTIHRHWRKDFRREVSPCHGSGLKTRCSNGTSWRLSEGPKVSHPAQWKAALSSQKRSTSLKSDTVVRDSWKSRCARGLIWWRRGVQKDLCQLPHFMLLVLEEALQPAVGSRFDRWQMGANLWDCEFLLDLPVRSRKLSQKHCWCHRYCRYCRRQWCGWCDCGWWYDSCCSCIVGSGGRAAQRAMCVYCPLTRVSLHKIMYTCAFEV